MGDNPITNLTGSIRKYSKGNIIFFQGEAPRNAFYVQEGTVQVYAIDDEGDAYIVGFYGEGDLFPLDWLHDRSTDTTFYYEALTACELAPVEKQAYNAVANEEIVKNYVLDQFIRESTSGLIRNLALQQARAR